MVPEAMDCPFNIVHQGDGVIDSEGVRLNWYDVPWWGYPTLEIYSFLIDLC